MMTHHLTIRADVWPPQGCLLPTEARGLQCTGERMHGTLGAAMPTTRRAVCNRQALETLTSLRGADSCSS